MGDDAHRVVLRAASPGAGFDVLVQPPLDGECFDRSYATYREARGYAGGLRMVRGWRVHDEARA